MPPPIILTLNVYPSRTQPPEEFAENGDIFFQNFGKMISDINDANAWVNVIYESFNNDKNDAADAKTEALQHKQDAATSAAQAQTALVAALIAKNATVDAASDVGAMDLLNARKAVKRQNARFFKLDLL